MVTFVVEHLEEEFYDWCQYGKMLVFLIIYTFLEYANMKKIVGEGNLLITNFSHEIENPENWKGVTFTKDSINDLKIPLERICLLNSEASSELCPADVDKFDYFLFGGILGNVDEFDFDRTSVLRVKGFPTRSLGSMQMTTDTAVRVSKMILVDKMPFPTIPFVDRPEFPIDEESGEKLVMNFRYVKGEDGEPLICPEVLQLLKDDFDFNLESLE